MKPARVLLFLLLSLLALALLSLLYPADGVLLWENKVLRFPGVVRDILWDRDDDVLPDSTTLVLPGDGLRNHSTQKLPEGGSLSPEWSPSFLDSAGLHLDRLLADPRPVEYPPDNAGHFSRFYAALWNSEESGQPVRIMHYGDSQIEGDRITSFLRETLQEQFGGSGTGLFAVSPVVNQTVSFSYHPSGNWKRYTYMDYRDSAVARRRFGVLMSFCAPEFKQNDSTARLLIRRAPTSLAKAREYRIGKIFYGTLSDPAGISIYQNKVLVVEETLPASGDPGCFSWNAPGGLIQTLELVFTGSKVPDIYGISLEDRTGVLVDNIPLRGSAGLDFSKTDHRNFLAMMQLLHPSLIILQFGINVIPGEAAGYAWYEKSFRAQLEYLKKSVPGSDFLVIGPGDLGKRSGQEVETYPNLEMVRDALRNAAFGSGIPFWDIYEAMGGKNSMRHWVEHDPPLARTDYAHFTFRGSQIIAELLLLSLMEDFNPGGSASPGRTDSLKLPDGVLDRSKN